MPWNPSAYNQFKQERFAPFDDLAKMIDAKPGLTVIDLGCGTGELTRRLADALPGSTITGIDSSAEMLNESGKYANSQTVFKQETIEEAVGSGLEWDVIFSNAALQWVDGHEALFPAIIHMLKPAGQLAVQMPSNHTHLTHTLIRDIAGTEPFNTALGGFNRRSPVLSIEQYAQILFDNGGRNITIFEKAYAHILPGAAALLKWVQGTALVPYMERLPIDMHAAFLNEYSQRINQHFTSAPVLYPFKRILMHAVF